LVRGAVGAGVIAPLTVTVVPLFWVADATHRASLMGLGRDQGIFQYIAWAIQRGERDYLAIRDVNGPLIHLIHVVFLALGGGDEHRFRVLDLSVTAATFAIVGWCLPSLISTSGDMVPATRRAAWALAATVALSAQYQLRSHWNQAQRESFCDWFLFASLALQWCHPPVTGRRAFARVVAFAALSVVPWFGKPTFAPFSFMQLGVLMFDVQWPLSRRARFGAFACGGVLGAAGPLGFVIWRGDIQAFIATYFVDGPRIYRFIWAKTAREIFAQGGNLRAASAGLAAAAVVIALVSHRLLPRRALTIAFAPLCALCNILIQHKGFDYHFHPLTAANHIAFLLVLARLSHLGGDRSDVSFRRTIVAASVAAYGFELAVNLLDSPQMRDIWLLAGAETAELRQKEEYINRFRTHDFFPWELRQAATFLKQETTPSARVQTYGMDPYVLFLAERRSATPYIYAYDLNDDAACEGGWRNKPSDADLSRIHAARATHENDFLSRVSASPPEAFVFIDHSPLMTFPSAWEDFQHCCSRSSQWVEKHYRPTRSFGDVHVWLRSDLPTAGNATQSP